MSYEFSPYAAFTVGSGNKNKIIHENINENEIHSKVEGYQEIIRSAWPSIPINDHIKYLRKDGKFVNNAFVRSINVELQSFYLCSDKYGKDGDIGIKFWYVKFDDI